MTTLKKGDVVIYHLFDGEFGHEPERGIFIDKLTARRYIIKFKDRIESCDKDWVMIDKGHFRYYKKDDNR